MFLFLGERLDESDEREVVLAVGTWHFTQSGKTVLESGGGGKAWMRLEKSLGSGAVPRGSDSLCGVFLESVVLSARESCFYAFDSVYIRSFNRKIRFVLVDTS